VDALGDVLDGVRARSASFCRVALSPPWALRIADQAPLALVATIRGEAWIVPDGDGPVRLRPGTVALVKGPAPYTFADDPGTPAQIVVGAGNSLRTLDGEALPDDALSALGDETQQASVVASGTYQVSGDVGRRLLDALPHVLVVAANEPAPGLRLLANEVGADAPGQQVMQDRLLDVALIETLRAWFASPATKAPGWYAAHADPVAGPALRMLHSDPAHGWTLDGLARRVGASRATLARRFSAVVGEPPMAYLANWRVTLAADLLRSTDLTVEAIAREVGYANGFALSVAFQRLRGIRPGAHRATPPGRTVATDR
jgi:AraC-like DNA-binding protein